MNLICGINPVLEALSAGTRHFDRLLVVKGIRNQRVSDAVARATQLGVPLRFEARETLDRMAGGLPHQGVIAVVSPKPVMPIEDLLREAHDPGLVVVLDGVEDPRNLGAILRSAEAAGADGVLLPDRHNAGLSETVSRASAGALEHVKVARIGNVAQAIESLKAKGFWVVGFDAEGRERWDAVDYKRSVAVVLGGEGKGMRRLVRERCDHVVSLPLFGHVASLNVSVVAGIALYEILRQRGVAPSHVRPIPHKRLQALEANVGPGPDDQEHDPGRHLHAPAHHHRGDDEGDESFVDDGEEEVRVTGLHDEEVAWAGPVVMKADEQRARRGDGRNDRRRDGRRGHKRPQGSPRETQPEAGPEGPRSNRGPGPGPGPGGGRRRRGRGRGRGGQPPPSPGAGGEPAGPPRAPEGGGGAAPESPTGIPPQGHRRRRRRRR